MCFLMAGSILQLYTAVTFCCTLGVLHSDFIYLVYHWVLDHICHSQQMIYADLVEDKQPAEKFRTKHICGLGGEGHINMHSSFKGGDGK